MHHHVIRDATVFFFSFLVCQRLENEYKRARNDRVCIKCVNAHRQIRRARSLKRCTATQTQPRHKGNEKSVDNDHIYFVVFSLPYFILFFKKIKFTRQHFCLFGECSWLVVLQRSKWKWRGLLIHRCCILIIDYTYWRIYCVFVYEWTKCTCNQNREYFSVVICRRLLPLFGRYNQFSVW